MCACVCVCRSFLPAQYLIFMALNRNTTLNLFSSWWCSLVNCIVCSVWTTELYGWKTISHSIISVRTSSITARRPTSLAPYLEQASLSWSQLTLRNDTHSLWLRARESVVIRSLFAIKCGQLCVRLALCGVCTNKVRSWCRKFKTFDTHFELVGSKNAPSLLHSLATVWASERI